MAGLTAEDLAGRKRAAVELIAREGAALRQTALRFSFCPEDAEDAYQRALEILLTKAPSERQRELARWTQTVVKHEALAIRRYRERMLGAPGAAEEEMSDRIARLPAGGEGPDETAVRRERLARSREALRALKPAELRALTLLAAGYSYTEIGEITGFSRTKVNRCLAEGRERFRGVFARSEDGRRCTELRPLLSAYCDGETAAEQASTVREHLQACGGCRATMRAYRSTPAAVAALAPALPVSRPLIERAHELFANLHARMPGTSGGADASMAQMAAAGGTRGAGMAALAKVLAVCAGTVGGAAACVATGVVPAPLDIASNHSPAPKIERFSEQAETAAPAVEYAPAEVAPAPRPPKQKETPPLQQDAPAGPAPVEAGAVEYTAPPPAEAPTAAPPSGSSGSAAGEFGP